MALTNLSQVTSSGIHTLSNYTTHNINSTGIITATEFSGNLSNSSGISTFAEIRVTGNLTVEGTTTTLDSNLTEVDRIEVGANSTNPGIAVTQSGTGAAAFFDGGDVNIATGNIALASATPMVVASNGSGHLRLGAGGSEKVRITSAGLVGIGTDDPKVKLHVENTSGTATRVIISQQKSYGVGTGTSERAGLDLAIRESSATTDNRVFARIETGTENETSSNNSFLSISTRNGGSIGERLRITSGGNIETIGNSDVYLGNDIYLTDGAGGHEQVEVDSNDIRVTGKHIHSQFGVWTRSTGVNNRRNGIDGDNNDLTLYSNSTEKVRITATGLVGIGTDNPTSNLTIAEDGASTNAELAINYTGSGNRTSAIRFQRGGTNYGYIAGAAFMLTTGAQDDLAIAPVSGKNLLFGIGNSEKLRITSSGNIGVNKTTPKEWYSTYKTLQIYDGGYIAGSSDDSFIAIGANNYLDTGGTYDYTNTDYASQLYQVDGQLLFRNAPSGTADTAITWTERLRIDSAGNIGISESTPDSKLDILHSTTTNSNTENLIHLRTDPGAGYVSRGLFVKIGRDGVYDNSAAHYDIVGSSGNSGFHAFEVQGNEKLRITKDGYVSIGENTASSINRRLYVAGSETTAYSSSDGSNNAYLRLINKNGTDNTGVNNHVGIEMYVATGATSVGMLSMVRTGNNTGDFTYKTRTGASTYAEHFRIASNGKVGINTNSPKQKLSVVGRANFDHDGDHYGAWIDGNSNGTSSYNVGAWYNTGGKFRNDGNNVVIETMNESHDIGIQPGANEGKSRVGVGIHGPGAKLHVRDTANAAGVTGTDILRIANLRVNTGAGSANLRFVTNEVSGTNQYTRAQIGAEYDGSSNVNGRLNFATTDSSGNLNEWARLNSVGKLLVVKGTYGFSNAYSKSNVNGHLEAGDFRISHPSDGFALTCGSYGRSNILNAYAGLGLATEYPKIGLFAVAEGSSYGQGDFAICINGTADSSVATLSHEKFRIKKNGNVGIGINDPTQKLHIGGGKIRQRGPSLTNLNQGDYYAFPTGKTISANQTKVFTFSGLQSGWMTIRGGGYSSAGQSQFSVMYHLGGYMTATHTYDVHTVRQWGSGVSISTTKNAQNFQISITNNSGSYSLTVHLYVEGSGPNQTVSSN